MWSQKFGLGQKFALILVLSNENSLFPDPAGMPARASGQRRPTVLPNSRTTPVPAPASNHTPAPGTSVQMAHPAHWKTQTNTSYKTDGDICHLTACITKMSL